MAVLFFILGSVFGSFVSLVSYRLPLEKDIIYTRSECPKCHYKLKIKNLFPIFSWLYFKGKCSNCKSPISIRYPLIEIFSGFIFSLIIVIFEISDFSILLLTLSILLITIITIDLEHYIIPDSLQIIFLIIALIWSYYIETSIIIICINMLVGFLSAFLINQIFKYVRNKDGLGFGDVKFIAIATIFIGYENLALLYLFSGLIGVIHGSIWLYLYKKPLYPFAPSLSIAFFLCLIISYLFDKLSYRGSFLDVLTNNLLKI
jgi:leader peptidase (prepilin peptidase)/N-methyltransferase